jgi:hypothetical protein
MLISVVVGMGGGPPPIAGLVVLWVIIYVFIAAYWILLWREVVRWTPPRVRRTVLAALGALVSGGLFGLFLTAFALPELEMVVLMGGGLPPIVWVLATVLIWRETRHERLTRLAATGGRAVICPLCGYNLTGLRDTRCPECGGHFTVDELVRAQAPDADADLAKD